MREFSKTIKKEMKRYNSPEANSIIQAQEKINDIKGTMSSNIEVMIQNHEEAESLVNKTDNLLSSTEISFFKKIYNISLILISIFITIQ